MEVETVYVVRYAALSKASDDPDQDSIDSQLAKIAGKLPQEHPEGFVVIGETAACKFADDGYSGSKGNRGPKLEEAIRTAVEAAQGGAPVELWANTPARFARGSGRRNEARALGELFYQLQRKGVRLRAVKDDLLVSDEMLVGFASKLAASYSDDLSESVTRAKKRALAKGEHLGGPVADGYVMVRHHDDAGKIIGRDPILDPPRALIWKAIFALALKDVSDTEVARTINGEGFRTKTGGLFDTRAIRNGVTNAWYAGNVVRHRGQPDQEIVQGTHPAICTPEDFATVQRLRKIRDVAVTGRKGPAKGGGRPPENHALAQLAICGGCGEPMNAHTSRYRRVDGSRRRTYVCDSTRYNPGACSVEPIDAEIVDAAVIAHLDRLLIDFDGWRERIEIGHTAEHARMVSEVARAQADHDAQADRTRRVQAKWAGYVAEGDDAKADLVLPMVERERDALASAELRLTATRDALASVPEDAPADAMLDFANALTKAVRGKVDPAGTMGQVNHALRGLFASFVLRPAPWAGVEAEGRPSYVEPGRDAVWIQPALLDTVAQGLWRETVQDEWPMAAETPDSEGDAPPLLWLPCLTPSDTGADATLTETEQDAGRQQ